MSIPKSCTVLVVGGGPAGSFAASALAREGIDVVVLEAEKFPRYHIGESTLPCLRHFLKLIGLYEKWNAHGFRTKNGASFMVNHTQPEAYTDFIAAGGPEGYAWNVIRSEADELLFQHAGSSGAHIFDATKVDGISFERGDDVHALDPGRPVSATWSRKDGTSGTITFDYVVDASGRRGLLSTKYLKNRKFNDNLKSLASWGYWKGGGVHGKGTYKEGVPFFEALEDGSGWCWFIPLHNGTHSVGIVLDQQIATTKKREKKYASSKDFYMQSLDLLPAIKQLLSGAELITDIQSASDWSYNASTYAFPYARISGDAGCFIDPFFSTGVHLAAMGGLSAAATIAASIKGDCDEKAAASWHSKKVAESYTPIFLVVSSVMKQIRAQEAPVIRSDGEESFDKAFELFRPVIQGAVDGNNAGDISRSEITKLTEYCLTALMKISPEKLESLQLGAGSDDEATAKVFEEFEKNPTPEQSQLLEIIKGTRIFNENAFNIDHFVLNSIDGLMVSLERGKLGLRAVKT